MLTELYIRNLAVIRETRVTLSPGLTIVSGEEGAGKSLLVDALCLLAGGRASASMIRSGESAGYVEGIFCLSPQDSEAADLLKEAGIEAEADGTLIVSREIQEQGRSVSRVNGKAVPLSLLRALGERLIDVHSQMEHLSLLNPQRQLDILDGYAGLLEDRAGLAAGVSLMWEKARKLHALTGEDARNRRDLLEHQVREIESANIQPGEDEALRQQHEVLQQAQSLKQQCYAAYTALYEDDGSASSLVDSAASAVRTLAAVDPSLLPYLQALESARAELEHAAQELRRYGDDLDTDPECLREVMDRLELLRHLKSRYGPGLDDVLEFARRCGEELEAADALEEHKARLEEERHALEDDVARRALALSEARREAAGRLAAAVNDELARLGMPWAKFDISLRREEREDGLPTAQGRYACSQHGIDTVAFLAATNPEEPLRPLAQIASGGETCRFMLAVKSSLQANDPVPLQVFDEIDTGIGGRTAHIVGRKLAALARDRQVICITHLPQIACFGDNHCKVVKRLDKGQAVARVEPLDDSPRVEELASMLGSEAEDHLLRSAEEMLRRARAAGENLVGVKA